MRTKNSRLRQSRQVPCHLGSQDGSTCALFRLPTTAFGVYDRRRLEIASDDVADADSWERSARPCSQVHPFAGHRKSPLRHQLDCAVHWPELRAAGLSAAVQDNSFLLAGDAPAASWPTADLREVCHTAAAEVMAESFRFWARRITSPILGIGVSPETCSVSIFGLGWPSVVVL
jgi:hypothetical protein